MAFKDEHMVDDNIVRLLCKFFSKKLLNFNNCTIHKVYTIKIYYKRYIPALSLTQYAWRWLKEICWCTKFTTSGLIGALKTDGKAIALFLTSSDFSVYTLTNGRAVDNDWNKIAFVKDVCSNKLQVNF